MTMSIENIEILSMNPHFQGLLMQLFLSGYNKSCDLRLAFMAMPILMYSESRNKLTTAKSTSRMETLFNTQDTLENGVKISGKVKLSGYIERYKQIVPLSKKALIVLYSKKQIMVNKGKIILLKSKNYKVYNGIMREWAKAAYYLGVVFAKTNEDHLNYFLGVDRL
jgi:hypothetical protein